MIEEWTKPLVDVFPIEEDMKYKPVDIKYTRGGTRRSSNIKIAKPKIFIPIFTGTHGEYDMAASFEKAGGIVDTLYLNTNKGRYRKVLQGNGK